MWLHATVCTSRVDASIAAEILAIGKRRMRSKMAGAMLLATAACWWEKCFTLTLTITKFQIHDQCNG